MEWYTWVFSGIGVFILSGIIKFILNNKDKTPNKLKNENNSNLSVNVNNYLSQSQDIPENTDYDNGELEKIKKLTNIIFVDDDTKFQVVNILKKAGWTNTKSMRDIISLDNLEIRNAHILFIDINGVGKAMQFNDEGLGLASALIDKYPDKKIVIYSAEAHGDRFHDSLKKAHNTLRKNADPYEFQQIVEQYSIELMKNGKL